MANNLLERARDCAKTLTEAPPDTPPPPEPDPDAPVVVRVVEVLKQNYLDVEDRLAPNGALRRWRLYCTRIVLFVVITAGAGAVILFALGLLVGALLALLTKILAVVATLAAIVVIVMLLGAWCKRQ